MTMSIITRKDRSRKGNWCTRTAIYTKGPSRCLLRTFNCSAGSFVAHSLLWSRTTSPAEPMESWSTPVAVSTEAPSRCPLGPSCVTVISNTAIK